MRIVWDEPKRQQNIAIHGYDIGAFEWREASISTTYSGARGDRRSKAVGMFDGHFVTIIFAWIGTEAISIISFRPASRKEIRDHAGR